MTNFSGGAGAFVLFWLLGAVAVTTLVILILAFSRLSFELAYEREGTDDCLYFEARALGGLYRYRLCVAAMEVGLTAGNEAGLRWKKIREAVLYLWDRVEFTRFEWHTAIGTGDPALTGIIAGVLWGIKGYVVKHLAGRLQSPAKVLISPNFLAPIFTTSLVVAAFLRLHHLLGAALYLWRARRQ